MSRKWWAYIDYPSYISHRSVQKAGSETSVSPCGLVELDGETRAETKQDRRCIVCAGSTQT